MKKLVAILVLCLTCAFCLIGFAACGDNSDKGTYYLYLNDNYVKTDYITLEDTTWIDNDGTSGTYEIKNGTIYLYSEMFGEKMLIFDGTIQKGVITMRGLNTETYYCKEGAKPSSATYNSGEISVKATVNYDANGGVFDNEVSVLTETAAIGSRLTAPVSPTRKNYTFSGWSKNKSGSEMWDFSQDAVEKNITLYAVWQQQSAIIFSVDGARINDREIFMLVEEEIDTVSLSNKVICSTDSTWRLYYDKMGQTEIPTKMASNPSGALNSGENLFYIVVSSQDGVQVNVYTLTVFRSYPVIITFYDGLTPLTIDYANTGYVYTADYTPDLYGYDFECWTTESGTVFTSDTVWQALRLYAKKTLKSYNVFLDVNGGNSLSQTEYILTFGDMFSFPVSTRTGHTFLGWGYGETLITDANGQLLVNWGYDIDNPTLIAAWQINDYTITAQTNDTAAGSVSGGGTYAYNSEITLTATLNKGYDFLGWYNNENNSLLSNDLSYTFKVPSKDVSYTAKWKIKEEMQNFYFTSTVSDCKINGVKDTTVSEIFIPDYITSISEITFNYCSNLTSIFVDNDNMCFTSIDGILYSKNGETLLTYPIGKTASEFTVPDSVLYIGEYAFYGCIALENIYISNNIIGIGSEAFFRCSNLQFNEYDNGLYLGNSANPYLIFMMPVDTLIFSSDNQDYDGIINIHNETKSIAEYAFSRRIDGEIYVYGIKSIIIPESVLYIGNGYFFCVGGKNITFQGSVEQWNMIEKGNFVSFDEGGVVVHCSDGDTVWE